MSIIVQLLLWLTCSIPDGADYHDDTWFTAEGVAFGTADEEDECWMPVLLVSS